MALLLTPASPSWHVVLAATFSWMAIQAHLSAAFVGVPLLAALTIRPFYERSTDVRRSFSDRLKVAMTIAATIGVLQVPFVVSVLREPSAPAGPTAALAGLVNPKAFRPWFAFDSVSGITGNLVVPMSDGFTFAIPVLIASLIVGIVYRRDLVLIAMTAGSFVMATLLFTTSTRNFDGYWFITLTTALT